MMRNQISLSIHLIINTEQSAHQGYILIYQTFCKTRNIVEVL